MSVLFSGVSIMRKSMAILMLAGLALALACGDDNGNGPPPVTVQRIVVATPATAPGLDDVNDAVWSSITATAVDISSTIAPKVVAKPTAVPDSVLVKALIHDENLYLRLVWTDPTHSVWREVYTVDMIDVYARFFYDCCDDNAVNREDQLFVMFAGLPAGAYDTWNWRSLTTGPGFLAEGMTFEGDSLRPDEISSVIKPAIRNASIGGIQPTYMHPDGGAHTSHILYLSDATTLDANEALWDIGNTVPGWMVDTSIVTRSAAARESRWDITSVAAYDSLSEQHTVVLCRPLNTGYSDDLNLAVLDSVKAKIGTLDNQTAIGSGGTRRGFSREFWLIF
jgi:hypothetical protein